MRWNADRGVDELRRAVDSESSVDLRWSVHPFVVSHKTCTNMSMMHALFLLLLFGGWALRSDSVVLRDELLFKHWC